VEKDVVPSASQNVVLFRFHIFNRQFAKVDSLINDRDAPVSMRIFVGILLIKAVIKVRDGFAHT